MLTVEQAKKIKLSKDFTLWELLYSRKAEELKLLDEQLKITKDEIGFLKDLCVHVLQPLRDYLGVPIYVGSGFRSFIINLKVGGKKTSYHRKAKAADFTCDKLEEAFEFLKTLPYTELIWEDDGLHVWIHVAYDKFNLIKKTLRWDGKEYVKA